MCGPVFTTLQHVLARRSWARRRVGALVTGVAGRRSPPRHRRGGSPRARRRPLSRQTRRRRRARRRGRPARRRARRPRRRALLYRHENESAWSEQPLAPLGNDRWHADAAAARARPLALHRRVVGRRVGQLRLGLPPQGRRAAGRLRRAPRRRRALARRRRARADVVPITPTRALLGNAAALDRRRQRRRDRARGARARSRALGRGRAPSRSPLRHAPRPRARRRRRSGARALLVLVRAVPALDRRATASTAPSPTPSAPRRTSPSSASTSSTCRRSIPSARTHPQGPEQRAHRRAERRRAARGRSARAEGGHKAIHPRARHARRLPALRRARAQRSASRSRSTSPFRRRPIIRRSSEHPEWFVHRARRHDPIRRESAEEVSGRLSVRLRRAPTGARCGTSCKIGLPVLDRAGRPRLPRRQSAHQAAAVLGVVHRRGQGAAPRRRSSSPRRSRARRSCTRSPRPASRSRTPTSRGARRSRSSRNTCASSRRPRCANIFRPNFWPNTPDILPEHLQWGGRPRSCSALILAATLSSNYGIYGPAYELMEHEPRAGVEEYRRQREVPAAHAGTSTRADSLRRVIARVNRIRREQPGAAGHARAALPHDRQRLMILCYSQARRRRRRARRRQPRSAPRALGVDRPRPRRARRRTPTRPSRSTTCSARRAIAGAAGENFVELDPRIMPAHIFARPPLTRAASTTSSTSYDPETVTMRRRKDEGPEALAPNPLWYKDAIIYEIHVRAFADSNDDGIGDFNGLDRQARLPRRTSASPRSGCCRSIRRRCATAATTSPTTRTSTRATARSRTSRGLLEEAHRRGMRVITELVLNHTSSEHAWFQRSRRAAPGIASGATSTCGATRPRRYPDARIIFKDFETSNWSWDPVAKAYYWHRFYSHQPDLNFDNPDGPRGAVRRSSTSGSSWASTACGSTPCRTSTSAKARTARTCPRRTRSCTKLRTHVDEQLPRPHAARRSQPVARGRRRLLRRRRRMPHELPLPADAAHVHGDRARGSLPDRRHPAARRRRSPTAASGRRSCATTTS